jgi:type IV pilus assembly protein PilY1
VFKEMQGKRAGLSHFFPIPPSTIMDKAQNPACSQSLADPSFFDGERASYIDAVNALSFFTGTPLARSLLNLGYYFTSGDDVYRDWFGFGKGYSYPSSFKNSPLASDGRSVCWGCQHSAAIIIADSEPSADGLSPTVVNQLRAINGGPVYCPDSKPCGLGTFSGRDMGTDPISYADDNPDYLLDDVAKVLAHQDLQMASPPVVGDFDTRGQQSLVVHTVAYGFHSNLLRNTAEVSGGLYSTADDASSLRKALRKILKDVQERASSCVMYP